MALTMDSILKLSGAKKVAVLVVILAVIAGAYYYLLFTPQRNELNRLQNELNKLVAELNESKAIHRDLEKFNEQVNKLNAELAIARTQLPSEKEIPEILKNISSLGKESNLEFVLFRPKPEEPQQFYAKVPIEVNMFGTYHNTGVFFDRVSKLPRIINVVDFSMSRAKEPKAKGDSRDENVVRTNCLINTYRFIEKKSEDKKSGEKKTEQPKGT